MVHRPSVEERRQLHEIQNISHQKEKQVLQKEIDDKRMRVELEKERHLREQRFQEFSNLNKIWFTKSKFLISEILWVLGIMREKWKS